MEKSLKMDTRKQKRDKNSRKIWKRTIKESGLVGKQGDMAKINHGDSICSGSGSSNSSISSSSSSSSSSSRVKYEVFKLCDHHIKQVLILWPEALILRSLWRKVTLFDSQRRLFAAGGRLRRFWPAETRLNKSQHPRCRQMVTKYLHVIYVKQKMWRPQVATFVVARGYDF